jgi:hypothetical protein
MPRRKCAIVMGSDAGTDLAVGSARAKTFVRYGSDGLPRETSGMWVLAESAGRYRPTLPPNVYEFLARGNGGPQNRLLALLPPEVFARLIPHFEPVHLHRVVALSGPRTAEVALFSE